MYALILVLSVSAQNNNHATFDVSALLRQVEGKDQEASIKAAIELSEAALARQKDVVAHLPTVIKLLRSSSDDVKPFLCITIKNLQGNTAPHSQLALETLVGMISDKAVNRGLLTHAL